MLHAQADPATAARGAVTRIAVDLGASKRSLRVWGRKPKQSGADTPAELLDLEAENLRLRAELAKAKRASPSSRRPGGFNPPMISFQHIAEGISPSGASVVVYLARGRTAVFRKHKNCQGGRPPIFTAQPDKGHTVVERFFGDLKAVARCGHPVQQAHTRLSTWRRGRRRRDVAEEIVRHLQRRVA